VMEPRRWKLLVLVLRLGLAPNGEDQAESRGNE
jgi:hypothetical protein